MKARAVPPLDCSFEELAEFLANEDNFKPGVIFSSNVTPSELKPDPSSDLAENVPDRTTRTRASEWSQWESLWGDQRHLSFLHLGEALRVHLKSVSREAGVPVRKRRLWLRAWGLAVLLASARLLLRLAERHHYPRRVSPGRFSISRQDDPTQGCRALPRRKRVQQVLATPTQPSPITRRPLVHNLLSMSQLLHGQLKNMKCHSCPTVARVDRDCVRYTCGDCIRADMHVPPLPIEEAPVATQLELGAPAR